MQWREFQSKMLVRIHSYHSQSFHIFLNLTFHQNRSPEECCGTCNLTDKTDVYNLGNFFYFLLTNGLLPYHDISNKTLTNEKIRNGMLAVLPKYVEQSDNPAVLVIKQARLIAQQKEPLKRPTSHQLALWLSSMYDKLYS